MKGIPKRVTATAVVFPNPTTCERVIVGVAAASQTVALHDCATTGEAGSGNLVATLSTAAAQSFEIGALFRTGLVAVVSGGTPDITVVHGG